MSDHGPDAGPDPQPDAEPHPGPDAEPDTEADAELDVMKALRAHVPITLLADLADEKAPDSDEILRREGGDAEWLQPNGPKSQQ